MAGMAGVIAWMLLSATPVASQETCAYCRQIGSSTFACDAESGAVECSGTFYGYWCWDCSDDPEAVEAASGDVDLPQEPGVLGYEWAATLDRPGRAIVLDPKTDPIPEVWAAESAPILVMRSPCKGRVEAWTVSAIGPDRWKRLKVPAGPVGP